MPTSSLKKLIPFKLFISEQKAMSTMVNMNDSELAKLEFSDFPSDAAIDAWDKFKDRIRVGRAKDKAKNQSGNAAKQQREKEGQNLFKALKLKVGDYTNYGIVDKIADDGVYFKRGNNPSSKTLFSSQHANGELSFKSMKKISKDEYEKARASHSASMQAHTASTSRKMD